MLRDTWPILVGFLLYCFQAVILVRRGDWWQAEIYVGYAIANIGLAIMAARGQ